MDYHDFLHVKTTYSNELGFEPTNVPDWLFDFQQSLVNWSLRKGRAAIFADCGLGKTPMQLVWADNVHRHTGKRVLLLTPLAVTRQTQREAHKFGIDAEEARDGVLTGPIAIANYEQLHKFDPSDFSAIVCDESSILKSFGGATRKQVTRFMAKLPYRLLCTATAAPNDYVELGTSSEALGDLPHSEMLKRFFKQLDDKGQKSETKAQEHAEVLMEADPSYFQKLAYRVAQTIGQWRLRHHAVTHFWRWVASWARACRMPSDLGFQDGDFKLPELIENLHLVKSRTKPPGFLFDLPASGLGAEKEERIRTLSERTEFVANLVAHDQPAVVWAHLNQEADSLVSAIPGAEQIAGRTPDARKIELYEAFASGQLRVLVIKPKIGAWGLNWQHCCHTVTYPSHSYEQYHQLKGRFYRFGQPNRVRVDVVSTEGEMRVFGNLQKKADRAAAMFAALVREMNQATKIERKNIYTNNERTPSWL
jgi:hypothetical protein